MPVVPVVPAEFTAWADGRSAQQLSELGSRSQLLCASALLYFNPQEREPDPRGLTAVFYHLQSLDTTIVQLGQPAALVQPLRVMQRVFSELDGLPRSQRQRYPQRRARRCRRSTGASNRASIPC
ncbi:hypothetical protein D3879_24405 [Pseudomonas cavernicola]|uniref:Uncharacterized protein n=1 Tax=Pseudomonas cavernicola TaxID=2320866 RepID=A0A418X906_9PSED|nr:hypothetical protein D3879_24405 [Pseudomonas cavernicola]